MGTRHRELIAELRAVLGRARGAALAAVHAAERAAAAARAADTAARREADGAGRALLAEQSGRYAVADRRCRDDLARAAVALERLAAETAPGAASAPWTAWRVTPPRREQAAGLYRIGRLAVRPDVGTPPAGLVGLLDGNHLHVADPGHRLALTASPCDAAGAAPADDGRPADAAPAGGPTDEVVALVSTVLLRVLGSTTPGSVRLHVYDPGRLGGSLASFAPLAAAGLLTFVGPGGLGALLDDLVEQIRRINQTVLAGDYPSLRVLHAATGRRPEPWRVAVLLGDAGDRELSEEHRAQLGRLVRTGPACGVHLLVSGLGSPGEADRRRARSSGHGPPEAGRRRPPADPGARSTPPASDAPSDVDWLRAPSMDTVVLAGDQAWTSLTSNRLPVLLDPPPPAELITGTCRRIAEQARAGPEPAAFADLLPERVGGASSAQRLVAPIGVGADGRLIDVELGDTPPHALIGGPSGSGKTNLLYAWLGSLAARYGPEELALYLLDFKEGVSFARFAPGRRDPSWLPQVRLVGVNINDDREYGLALLEYLHEQLRVRAEAAKAHEASKLAELRERDPGGHWPRIVAVVDEFQVLLDGRDPVALAAARLLEDLARRGRSQGIHLVLASQDLSGIDALWGRTSMVAQFTLRIALPKARRILADTNPAADTVGRHHAVVNADSGAPGANRVAHIPDAGRPGTVDAVQRRLWEALPASATPPVLFDGGAVPALADAADFTGLVAGGAEPARPPVALVGQQIDVTGRSAAVRLTRSPGRNLAVLGARVDEACDVLASAVRSLARQYRPGSARFSLCWLDDDALEAAKLVLDRLRAADHQVDAADRDQLPGLLADAVDRVHRAATGPPHFVVLYAVDAAAGVLAAKDPTTRRSPRGDLQDLLSRGPELHSHVLGWWRSVPRLREDLGGVGARFDSFGAWVALDVHGGELAPLSTQPGGPAWYPRRRRGLLFDRAVHRVPRLVIPYRTGDRS